MPCRFNTEKAAVIHILTELESFGWIATMVNDGDEVIRIKGDKCKRVSDAVEAVFAVDEAYVYLAHSKFAYDTHWIRFVLGNSPEEVICDYSFTKGDPDGFSKLLDRINEEIEIPEDDPVTLRAKDAAGDLLDCLEAIMAGIAGCQKDEPYEKARKLIAAIRG